MTQLTQDKLTRYRNADTLLPKTYLAWELYGAGPEHLGRDHKPVELPLREPAEDEILVRVDAVGVCFSDTKLVWAGSEHPRIPGRDLEKNPTVPGHEAALTVVAVGAKWRENYKLGERFLIQADIFVNGEQKAFGYVQRGAFAQYAYLGDMVLAGDDGCYLLPLQETTGYAEAALVEPWACVAAAYHIPQRTAPQPDGSLLILATSLAKVDFSNVYAKGASPKKLIMMGEFEGNLAPILGNQGHIFRDTPTAQSVTSSVQEQTAGRGYDDIFLLGAMTADLIQACDAALAVGGTLAFLDHADYPVVELDAGRIHYKGTRHVGALDTNIKQAYAVDTRCEIKPGGLMWIVGATGPMGQMHLQRALEHSQPPRAILATGRDPDRLAYVRERFLPLAEERGVQLVVHPTGKPADLVAAIEELRTSEDEGFDDILVNAPVPELVTEAVEFAAHGAVINIFAGMKLGTMVRIPPALFAKKKIRLVGSSGSSMEDIRDVLREVESGTLQTRMSVSAIGGIETGWDGLVGVKESRFPGKTVLFPHLANLPLIPPSQITELAPEAAAKLDGHGVWTTAAENALFEALLNI